MGKDFPKIERPKPVSELVLDRLRQDIIENRFALGEKISEFQLSELYGVTKAPIRSAYIRLEGEGLIEIRPQAGTFVFRPSVQELRALCELRTALEVEAMFLALQRDPEGLEADIRAICTRMRDALRTRDLAAYQGLDTDFHRAILSRAASPLMEHTFQTQVNSRFAALRFRFSQEESHNANSIQEHEALRDAIIDRRVDDVLAELRAHIANTERYYTTLVT